MKSQALLFVLLPLLVDGLKNRYNFFKNMDRTEEGKPSRRVFGGEPVDLKDFPAVAALMDRYMSPRCSGAVVSENWVLTAAHCIGSHVAFVRYNTRHPRTKEGNTATVMFLYKHPQFQVVEEDEGRGADITGLHHDVGLIRTHEVMKLDHQLQMNPMQAIKQYAPKQLNFEEIEVLGFGRTDRAQYNLGDELFAVKLKIVNCDRNTWTHCVCGTGTGQEGRGVCSGDSGGPMVYKGAQIGVTSMGPVECATRMDPGPAATSVFTSLHEYVDLINATISDTEDSVKMIQLAGCIEDELEYNDVETNEPLTEIAALVQANEGEDTDDVDTDDVNPAAMEFLTGTTSQLAFIRSASSSMNPLSDREFLAALVESEGYTPEGDLGPNPGAKDRLEPMATIIICSLVLCLRA